MREPNPDKLNELIGKPHALRLGFRSRRVGCGQLMLGLLGSRACVFDVTAYMGQFALADRQLETEASQVRLGSLVPMLRGVHIALRGMLLRG